MTGLDWSVLLGTIAFIVAYGVWKTRGITTTEGYLRGGNELKWHTVGLSIMATQASAITFLSMPGQAYEDGMGFVQFYFGLPIAMVVISVVIVPIYYRLRVYTAYQYLESRFDVRVRMLGAFLFLVSRGLAAGITIYAPAIILSSLMGWSLNATNLAIGVLVILYTVMGGTKAVSQTQKQQMVIMLGGILFAAIVMIDQLPEGVSLDGAVAAAGALGKTEVVDLSFDLTSRYNIWSGVLGGFFLAMAYFGTDQSQVQRYLSGQSVAQSRLGLLFNGMLKIPMQFVILFVGVLVFVFYLFQPPPVFFNEPARQQVYQTQYAGQMADIEKAWTKAFERRRDRARDLVNAVEAGDAAAEAAAKKSLQEAHAEMTGLRKQAKATIKAADPDAETKDSDYIFLTFVLTALPAGMVGLLLAVILSAAMSSTASELNALGSTTTIDFYKRAFKPEASDKHYLRASKLFTMGWGLLAVAFATFASLLDNLIQAVNILGSIFYGTVLGIFLVGFFLKAVGARAVLAAAVVAQATVVVIFVATDIGYLWYNVIGCAVVVLLALMLQPILRGEVKSAD